MPRLFLFQDWSTNNLVHLSIRWTGGTYYDRLTSGELKQVQCLGCILLLSSILHPYYFITHMYGTGDIMSSWPWIRFCVLIWLLCSSKGENPCFFWSFRQDRNCFLPLHLKISVVIAFREITLIKYILKYINVYTT